MRRPLALVLVVLCTARVALAGVTTTDETWHDPARTRDIPVRIYLDDARPERPAPIIFLSHGLGGSREAMGFAAEAWAARGYVCVTLQHAGSDESIWKDAPIGQRMSAIKSGMTAKAYFDRCRDVSFAIDEAARRHEQTGRLKGRVDVTQVGLAGHSFGAQTVQAIIGQRPGRANAELSAADPRVKAAVAFSPAYDKPDPKSAFAAVKTPCFHFTGTKDESPVGGATAADRRVPFDAIEAPDQYLVILDGGDHAVFGGGNGRRSDAASRQYPAWRALIVELTTKFWDAELRNDADAKAWLENDAKATVGSAGTFERK